MESTICLILGGGQGSRLFPLTKDRSKPAVPIGGKFRLIDIPVSSSLNSGINRILILTQFNSASLNQHINNTYRFDNFHEGFVDILAAEQTMVNTTWYQGTADAVRKNMKHIESFRGVKHVLILSGDQIYNMDFRELMAFHEEKKAEVTVSVIPCTRHDAEGFGILKQSHGIIEEFVEKPKETALLESLKSTSFIQEKFPGIEKDKEYLASMGIYLFNMETLRELMAQDFKDFGREVIPYAIEHKRTAGYLFNGYWEDVGTIKTFWNANLDFVSRNPRYDLFAGNIFTRARYLPPSRVDNCTIIESLICEGSLLRDSRIERSIVGIRCRIQAGVTVKNSYLMGADFYEKDEEKKHSEKLGLPPLGIGEGSRIENAIVDKNARIGRGCILTNEKGVEHLDGPQYFIRDRIIIIPKGEVIPDGTVI